MDPDFSKTYNISVEKILEGFENKDRVERLTEENKNLDARIKELISEKNKLELELCEGNGLYFCLHFRLDIRSQIYFQNQKLKGHSICYRYRT